MLAKKCDLRWSGEGSCVRVRELKSKKEKKNRNPRKLSENGDIKRHLKSTLHWKQWLYDR